MTRLPWRMAAVGLLLTAAGAMVVSAAPLLNKSLGVGSGGASVAACDSDGFVVAINLSGNNVASVTLSGITSACSGRTAKVTVTGSTSSSGSGVVPSGGSMTITLSTAVALVQSMRIDTTVSSS